MEVSRESVEMLTGVSASIAGKAPVRKPLGTNPNAHYFAESFQVADLHFDLVEIKSTLDPDWQTWRNSLKGVVGGSDFASLMGHGYTSPRACLKEILGLKQKKEPNGFAKTCMKHGKTYESTVLEVLKKDLIRCRSSECEHDRHSNLNVSLVYEFHDVKDPSGKKLRICISPDHLDREGTLIEVKCPYVGSTGEFGDNSTEFLKSLVDENYRAKGGRESYYLQALFYFSILTQTMITLSPDQVLNPRGMHVAVGAVSNQESISVAFSTYYAVDFSASDPHEYADMIVWKGLEKLLLHSDAISVENYRVTKKERDGISATMKSVCDDLCMTGPWKIGVNGNLLEEESSNSEEQSEYTSREDDPTPPWE